jgi:hypothetical protein
MSKMGLHDPFGSSKHKLWPKEGSEVKLAIWFLTTKSQESSWFLSVWVACHILLERSWQGLQLFFKLHLDRRSTKEVMSLQSRGSPNFEKFETLTWESRDKMTFGSWPMAWHKKYYKREGGGFPQIRAVVSLASSCLPVARICTNRLVIWFVQVHASNWLTYHSS